MISNNYNFCSLRDYGKCFCNDKTACSGRRQILEGDDFMYVTIGKSASTSIRSCLKIKDSWVSPDHLISSDKYKFTFVRNPFSRLVSGYKTWIKEPRRWLSLNPTLYANMPFDKFITVLHDTRDEDMNEHFAPQMMYLNYNQDSMDFIGKVENIGEDWSVLSKKFGFNKLKHLGRTGGGDWREWYTEKTKRLVEHRYKEDLQEFGYEL